MSEKFDENKWRILAMNKPDELHSYIPQSSINELFDEIERLEKENFKLKEANEDVQSRLDDYRQDYATVVNDQCPTDERHCGCVPILRRENRILSEDLANAKDELKHRRDALIDAQTIYNDANNHRMRYLTALELIASFVNAKDKTSIDDLIAIAGKELNCSSDRILDACNYWVMRLREEENKSRIVYIVTMYRYGDREKHSYVLGAFSTEATAREWGEKEKDYRGGKYEPEIIRFYVDSPTDLNRGNSRNGSHWDGCAEAHWDCKIVLLETEKAFLKSIIAGKDQTLSEIAMELAYLSEGHKTMYAVEVYWKFASENFEYGLIQADTLAEANEKMRAMYPDAIQILIRELEFNEQGYFTIYEH